MVALQGVHFLIKDHYHEGYQVIVLIPYALCLFMMNIQMEFKIAHNLLYTLKLLLSAVGYLCSQCC